MVLDQKPRLAALFSPDGWSWNILNPRVRDLLKDVRRELYEVFPNARYVHLGCDEVYSYEKGDEDQRRMRSFLRSVIEEVQMEGVRPIIWGDMLLNARACGVDGGHQPYVLSLIHISFAETSASSPGKSRSESCGCESRN